MACKRQPPLLIPETKVTTSPSPDPPPLMRLEDVVKRRRKSGHHFELRIPRLTVRRGEFLVIAGESGSGKSTLTDILGLLLSPDSAAAFEFHGALRTNGKGGAVTDLRSARAAVVERLRRECIGYVLQTGGLLSSLTTENNIQLQARLNGLHAAGALAARMGEALGIGGLMGKKPQYLSGGERQRVAVARALIHRPLLIIADEPTAALDRRNALRMIHELKLAIRASGTAVVMVTHDLGLIEDTADRILTVRCLEAGEGLCVGVCDERDSASGDLPAPLIIGNEISDTFHSPGGGRSPA